MFPLIKNFKADNITKAFLLTALTTSIITTAAIILKDRIDLYAKYNINTKTTYLFIITFIISLSVLFSMNVIVGYGGGLLS